MPDIIYDTLDAVPEGLREGAKEDNGKIVVKVVPANKLDEFRENNIKLRQEFEGVQKQFESVKGVIGEDFESFKKEYGELKTLGKKFADKELVENKGLDAALAERTAQMRQQLEEQIGTKAREAAAWQDKFSQTDAKFRRTFIDRAITDVVLDESMGVHPKAVADILSRAYGVFNVGDDGALKPMKGDAVLYGADGVSPMTPKEWIKALKDEAPYFFKNSNGGGSTGGDVKNFGGYTAEDFQKLPPEQRLAIANGEHRRR